jgi:hypothetical protein
MIQMKNELSNKKCYSAGKEMARCSSEKIKEMSHMRVLNIAFENSSPVLNESLRFEAEAPLNNT